MRTADGVVPGAPIQDALADLPAVRLAVTYGVDGVSVAAVRLRKGKKLTAADLNRVLAPLGRPGRPQVVRVVGDIPVTTWFRPRTAELRAEGIPDPAKPATAWHWDEKSKGYKPLTKAARERLLKAAA